MNSHDDRFMRRQVHASAGNDTRNRGVTARDTTMKALVVGADRLGNIPQVLTEYGISIMRHVSGRDPSAQRADRSVPAGAELLILFTDFLGHNVMRGYREAARRQGLAVLACRRSTCSLRGAIESCACCPHRRDGPGKDD